MATETTAEDQNAPKIFTLKEISRILDDTFNNSLIQAISDGFVAFEQGEFYAAPIQTLGAPPMAPFVEVNGYAGQTCVKAGYFRNHDYYCLKVASGGYPLPNSGLVQVFSQKTGRLKALLLDEGVLTELRTAAVGALVFQLFVAGSSLEVGCIGILGTGVQARYQLKMLSSVTTCRNVLVWGRNLAKAQALQAEMADLGWKVSIAQNADDLLIMCDMVVTTTCAREPVLGTTEVGDTVRAKLITCIGSDAPGKQELSMKLIDKATLLVADSLLQTRTRGEFQEFCAQNPDTNRILPLGKVIEDPNLRQTDAKKDSLVIFDSSGVSLQDCVIAQMVIDRLERNT